MNLNNSISKTFQWKADGNAFGGSAKVFEVLIKGGYTHVEFLKPDGSVLHETTVPGAAATLGTYATRCNKMLAEGCTWEEAATPRKSISRSNLGAITIDLTETTATFTAGDLTVTVDHDLNIHVPVLRAQADLTAIKLAQGFILEYCGLGNYAWLAKFIKPRKVATAGKYSVDLPTNATEADAQVALLKAINAAIADGTGSIDDFKLLADVKLADAGSVDSKIANSWIRVR